MQQYRMSGVVTALSSISHNGGESFGITSKMRREKFVQPDGSVEHVPVISGNGMRGMLRDRGMLHMCRALGYGVDDGEGTVQGLTLAAFHFLFSGGALTDSGKALDIEKSRQLRELIPLVGVFGGAVGNMIPPGKLKCGKLIPLCRETQHLLPEQFQSEGALSIWDYLQEEMYTRKDDEKHEHLRTMIAAAERPQLKAKPAKALAGLFAEPQEEKAALAEQKEHKQQMMYFVETLAAGTRFFWDIVLDDVTEVEFEAFLTTLAEFSKMPYIGGKSGVGLGQVSVDFGKWTRIDSRLTTASEAVAQPLGANYAAHLQTRGAEIRQYLGEMK